jgi:hypothetical protein
MKALRMLVPGLLLAGLLSSGCIITSAQITISYDLPATFRSNTSTTVAGEFVDLNTIGDYKDHKDKLKGLVDLAVLGKFKNNLGTAVKGEVWIYPDLSALPVTLPNAATIRSGGILLWGPLSLGGNQEKQIGWDESAGLFSKTGKASLINQIKGDGQFVLYVIGDTGTFDFTITNGALVLTLDAGL